MSNVVYVAEPSIAAGAQSLTCAPGNNSARLSCHYFQCRFYITLSGSSRNSNSNKEKRQKNEKKNPHHALCSDNYVLEEKDNLDF